MEPSKMSDRFSKEIGKLGDFGEFNVKFFAGHLAAEMSEMMTSGVSSDAGSESSAAGATNRKMRLAKAKTDKTSERLHSRKIHHHTKDKPYFDSYNVFNRQMPPHNAFSNPDVSILGGGDGPDETIHCDVIGGDSDTSSGQVGNRICEEASKTSSARKRKTKRPNPMKRLQRTKLKAKTTDKKPLNEHVAREVAREAGKYMMVLRATANEDENPRVEESGKLDWNADDEDDSGFENHEDNKAKDVESSHLALFQTIAEIRNQSGASGTLWNSGLIFVDQGLAYNHMARERRVWTNDKSTVVTDLSDPATDAVRLVGLSMGGLIMPKSGNPYDYTISYLEAMIEKYPVLRPENMSGHKAYELALNKVAEMFPVVVTMHYILMGDPQLGSMDELGYGLPLAIYLEGFPSLVCQHHLEKDYNILPFLMVNMIARLGTTFKEATPVGRLRMAYIAWKHLKDSINSTSLPWYFRELFCRKYGLCENPDFYPTYGRDREKSMMDLARLVGHADVSSLMASIDEYDFRKECPSANELRPTQWEMYYMNIFYSRAVKHLQVGHKQESRTENQNLTRTDSSGDTVEEIRDVLGGNRLVENLPPDEDDPKNRWFINLENDDEIE